MGAIGAAPFVASGAATTSTTIASEAETAPRGLTGRVPVVAPERLLDELVPPPRFADARFDTYLPDPAEPSQAAALDLLQHLVGHHAGRRRYAS